MMRTALGSMHTNARLFNYALHRQISEALRGFDALLLEMATPLRAPRLRVLDLINLTTRFLF